MRRRTSSCPTSYTVVGGPWTGPILKQLAANDPDVEAGRAVQWHDACRQRRSGQSACDADPVPVSDPR